MFHSPAGVGAIVIFPLRGKGMTTDILACMLLNEPVEGAAADLPEKARPRIASQAINQGQPMDPLQSFARQIEKRLAASRKLPVRSSADFEQSMGRFASQLQELEMLDRRVMADVLRPRMERLASYFSERFARAAVE